MNIKEKLLQVQSKLKAPKNRYNQFGEYKYRSCEDILEAVKPLLDDVKAVIYLSDGLDDIEGRAYISAKAVFADTESDEEITVTAFAKESLERKKMVDPQLTGTASSYARKYALNGLLLIDDVKDPDTDEYHKELDQIINEKQLNEINKLLKEASVTEQKFCEIYNIGMVIDLPADKYNDAVKKLQAAVKAHKKEED